MKSCLNCAWNLSSTNKKGEFEMPERCIGKDATTCGNFYEYIKQEESK